MAQVVILGAGLTGLSAAYHLEQQGIFEYKIFEKNNCAGGLLQSFSQNGFTFDFTGHLLHVSNDYFKSFLNNIAGLDNFLYINRKSAIHTHNTLLPYPFQMNLYGLPPEIIYECINGFINRKKSLRKPKTFYQWVLKYFGSGIGRNFFFPYNSKILSYNIKKIHPSWTGRFVPQTNLRAVVKGAITPTKNRKVGYNNYFYYPKHGGIEFIVKKMINIIKQPIILQHEAVNIDPIKKVVYFSNGTKEHYETLITTIPLNILLQKTNWNSRTTLKKAAKKLLCNTVLNFNVGFNIPNISTKHWLYFPEKKFYFYRIGFWNNICPNAAPQGMSSIYGEISFLPGIETKLQHKALLDNSLKQALDFLQLTTNNIVTLKHLILHNAYVIYDEFREKNLANILQRLKDYQIFSIGRFGEWKYSSMQEAVLDGKQVAQKITSYIKKNKIKNYYNNNQHTSI